MSNTATLAIVPPERITQTADAFALLDEYLAVLDAQVQADQVSSATRTTYATGIGSL